MITFFLFSFFFFLHNFLLNSSLSLSLPSIYYILRLWTINIMQLHIHLSFLLSRPRHLYFFSAPASVMTRIRALVLRRSSLLIRIPGLGLKCLVFDKFQLSIFGLASVVQELSSCRYLATQKSEELIHRTTQASTNVYWCYTTTDTAQS